LLSYGNDADYLVEPREVIGVATVQIQAIGVRVAAINKPANLLRGFRPSCTTAATMSP
jgi:hypothetical protein